ncbi:molybdopterin oxidoreductase [Mesobacillus boroniphilus JCM 21738]|uniref:Molybdopterin oxidoreductase n=1 Tax=Mesobacillus boroniphilus JCM 21738 TaxID=1294265 RepID=W4RH86_9BACI|nr:molybdopterin oxidoreductase [Mesobacillus boroniphilus JCM 21738]
MGLFSNEKKVDYDKIVDKMVPDAKKEMDESQYDTDLGLNMARDARKVISGKLKIEDFHKVYSSSLTKEFGNYYASADGPDIRKGDGPKWAMIIDLKKCVGCDTCTVSCKAENRTPPGISYNVVMESLEGEFPNIKQSTCQGRACSVTNRHVHRFVRQERLIKWRTGLSQSTMTAASAAVTASLLVLMERVPLILATATNRKCKGPMT